jgi:hypothetical protein
MNPPINRENLRDVLIALVVASGLAWAVGAFGGCAAVTRTQSATPYRPAGPITGVIGDRDSPAFADVL